MQANGLPWAHIEKKGNYKLEKIRWLGSQQVPPPQLHSGQGRNVASLLPQSPQIRAALSPRIRVARAHSTQRSS